MGFFFGDSNKLRGPGIVLTFGEDGGVVQTADGRASAPYFGALQDGMLVGDGMEVDINPRQICWLLEQRGAIERARGGTWKECLDRSDAAL